MVTLKQMLTLTAVLSLSTGLALANSKGAELYKKHNCHTCHGANGNAPIMPLYPKIGGQNAEYAIAQLKDIKSGKRNNGQSAAMKALTTSISDADFKAISEWLATVK